MSFALVNCIYLDVELLWIWQQRLLWFISFKHSPYWVPALCYVVPIPSALAVEMLRLNDAALSYNPLLRAFFLLECLHCLYYFSAYSSSCGRTQQFGKTHLPSLSVRALVDCLTLTLRYALDFPFFILLRVQVFTKYAWSKASLRVRKLTWYDSTYLLSLGYLQNLRCWNQSRNHWPFEDGIHCRRSSIYRSQCLLNLQYLSPGFLHPLL